MSPLKLVHIRWIDSEVAADWTDLADIDRVFDPIESVGFLINENEEGYTLAGMAAPETDCYNNLQYIPRGCVKKVTPLCLLMTTT
jgi:hypothetical protein